MGKSKIKKTICHSSILEIEPPALKSIPPPKRHVNEFVKMLLILKPALH